MLSNLHSWEWWDERDALLPLLRTLLVPTIRSMKLRSGWWTFWATSPAKSTLLGSLRARCPSIKELVCAYDRDSSPIAEFVCGLQELSHLETGALDMRSLRRLAALPSLKSLHFWINDSDDTRSDSIATFASHLDEVRITAPLPHVFTRRLRNVCFLSCRSVMLYVDDSDTPVSYSDAQILLDIPSLMISFSECFSPALERLEMNFYDADGPPLVLGFNAVAPLLSFGHLTKLDLDWFRTSTISDSALERMAQSWPQLEEFCFGTASEEVVSPSLTFIGLVYLIRYCRHLRFIAMSFCASAIDVNCEPFSKTTPNEKITSINVGISPIINPIAVACQLHVLLPNLTLLPTYIESSLPRPFEHIKADWSKVEEFLMVLTECAKTREKIGRASQVSLLA
jgi:hypothetical protein